MKDAKILQFRPNSNMLFRLKRRNFSGYQALFYASLSFNIILGVALYVTKS